MRESERKRLVELLCGFYKEYAGGHYVFYLTDDEAEEVADHLLDNGIVVPPVKVGQTVYIVAQISQIIVETKVIGVWTYGDRCNIITDQGIILMNAIGKTAFTSREDALKALEGKEDKGK